MRFRIALRSAQCAFSRPWFLVLMALLLVPLVAAFALMQFGSVEQSVPDDLDFSSAGTTQVERGEYLARAGNCATCHTSDNGAHMAGGLAFETPFGTIYSTNITPDVDTGIGAWTGEQFFRSMRHGIRPGGEHLYPVFPYTAFTKILNEDIVALFAYLKSIPAIRQPATENDLSFPFSQRALMAAWKAMFFTAGQYTPVAGKSAQWNRGAYLVEALAHCSACHSPRNFLGAEKAGNAMTGGKYLDKVPGGKLRTWSAPGLTSATHGLGLWPQEEIVAYLKTGLNSYVETFGPMNEVILNSTRYLRDDDLGAMALYLKSLPVHTEAPAPAPDQGVMGMGRTVYNLHCGTCHLPTGLGDEESAPRLAGGSLVVQARDPASLINVILYAPELPDPPLPTKRREPMEEFQYLLTDEEIAAVATYVRNTWGNAAGAVTAKQVAEQR